MDKDKITQNQYTFIVFGSMLAVGILSMASNLCKIAKQSGWIPILVGGLYPLFILITASIIDNKTNHASFWEISNKIYGKTLSYIFSTIFFFYFLTLFSSVVSGYASVLILTITSFLKPVYIILPTILLIVVISRSGIQMVGRMSEFYFHVTAPLLLITLFLIQNGNIVNVMPVSISFNEIKESIPVTSFAFSGCEISYFIISKISNRKNTKKPAFIATALLVFVYVLNVFMVIYNLGWRLTSELRYPLLYIIQSIDIPIISNFLSIVIFLWSIIIFKSLLGYSFTISQILSKNMKIDYKKANYLLFVISIIYSLFMIPECNIKVILDIFLQFFVIFSLSWGLITTIIVSIKYRGCEK